MTIVISPLYGVYAGAVYAVALYGVYASSAYKQDIG